MKQRSIRLIQDFNLDRNSGVNCTMIMRVLLMNISIVSRSYYGRYVAQFKVHLLLCSSIGGKEKGRLNNKLNTRYR